jgi:hypothetical protein
MNPTAFERMFSDEQFFQFLLYGSMLFLVPLVLGHLQGSFNQLFVGTIVNFLLALCALRLESWKKIAFLMLLPSVGAYLSGIVFGVNTSFLLYFIPAIWVANAIFVFGIKKIFVEMKNHSLGIIVPSLVKAGFLFAVAFFLINAGLVPSMFLAAMGIMQLATALAGGFLAVVISPSLKF